MDPPDRIIQEKPRRKGCFGCLFTGVLGCAAFLIGSLTAALLFAPQLLGDLVAAGLERAVNREIDGELRIDALELAWTGMQRADVQLLDPRGREVLVVDAELPSLLSLLDIDESLDRFDFNVRRAEIVVEDDGVTNLERSFGHDGEMPDYAAWVREVQWDRPGLHGAPFRMRLRGSQISWEDRRFPGEVAGFGNLELSVVNTRVPSLTIEGSIEVKGEPGGRMTLGCVLTRPDGWAWKEIEADVQATALPSSALDLLLGAGGSLAVALGPSLDLSVDVSGDMDTGAPLTAHAMGESLEADLAANLRRGVLTAAEPGLHVLLAVPDSFCERLFAPLLPAGAQLIRTDAASAWTVTARRFEIPLAGVSDSALSEGLALDAKVLPGTGLRLVAEDQIPTELHDVGARISIAPDVPPTLELYADVAGTETDGVLQSRVFVALTGWPLLDALLPPPSGAAARSRAMAIEVEAPVLPARVLDLYLGRDELFQGAFGPALHLSLNLPAHDAEGEPLELVALSPSASLQWSGIVSRGVVQSGPGGLRARVPHDSELGRLLAGRFMPWLKPVAERASSSAELFVDDLVVGSWDEPASISGRARVEFERFAYRYVAGLEGMVEGGSPRGRTEPPEPLVVAIAAGTVTYDAAPLALGGRTCSVSGTMDLTTDRLDLEILAPMGIFVQGLGLEPGVADVLDPGLEVPIQISGTTADPRVSVGMQAFTSLLQGGLEGLLGTTGGRLLRNALVEGSPGEEDEDPEDQ